MRRTGLLATTFLTVALSACATGSFRQVSFAGEASPIPTDSAGRTVHVVRNTEMKDTVLEAKIRARLEDFLLQRGFAMAPAGVAEIYVMAVFGTGPRVVGSTVAVFRPAEVKTQRSPSGQVVGRSYTPDRMEQWRVPSVENSVWLMVLSSDAKHYRETGQVKNLWRGEAAMRGKPDAMAEATPYLLVPALKYFGKGTRQTILMDVREKDLVWK